MKTLPHGVSEHRRTPEFDQDSIPAGLLSAHRTRSGTWGRIVVTEGALLYRILESDVEEVLLSPARHGIVEPTVLHEVRATGPVRFHVEFCR